MPSPPGDADEWRARGQRTDAQDEQRTDAEDEENEGARGQQTDAEDEDEGAQGQQRDTEDEEQDNGARRLRKRRETRGKKRGQQTDAEDEDEGAQGLETDAEDEEQDNGARRLRKRRKTRGKKKADSSKGIRRTDPKNRYEKGLNAYYNCENTKMNAEMIRKEYRKVGKAPRGNDIKKAVVREVTKALYDCCFLGCKLKELRCANGEECVFFEPGNRHGVDKAFCVGLFHCMCTQNPQNRKGVMKPDCNGRLICLGCAIFTVLKSKRIVCMSCGKITGELETFPVYNLLYKLWGQHIDPSVRDSTKCYIPSRVMDLIRKSDLARLAKALLLVLFDRGKKKPPSEVMVLLKDKDAHAAKKLRRFMAEVFKIFGTKHPEKRSEDETLWTKFGPQEQSLKEALRIRPVHNEPVGKVLFQEIWGAFEDSEDMRPRYILHREFWFLFNLLNENLSEEERIKASHHNPPEQDEDPTQPVTFLVGGDPRLNPLLHVGPGGVALQFTPSNCDKDKYPIFWLYMVLNHVVENPKAAMDDDFPWIPPVIPVLNGMSGEAERLAKVLSKILRRMDEVKGVKKVAESLHCLTKFAGSLESKFRGSMEALDHLYHAHDLWNTSVQARQKTMNALQLEEGGEPDGDTPTHPDTRSKKRGKGSRKGRQSHHTSEEDSDQEDPRLRGD